MINLGVFNFYQKKRQKKERYCFLLEKEEIFLLSEGRNGSFKTIAKSNDGLNFQPSHWAVNLADKIKKYRKEKRRRINRFSDLIAPSTENIPTDRIQIENVFSTSQGWEVFFHLKETDGSFQVGLILVDKKDFRKIKWRRSSPIFSSDTNWQKNNVSFVDLIKYQGKYISYWYSPKIGLISIVYPVGKVKEEITAEKNRQLSKYPGNPIIEPDEEHSWESFNTFNPAAVYHKDRVHIFYRAQGHNYISSIGYAVSQDGVNIDQRSKKPIYQVDDQLKQVKRPDRVRKEFVSGGGYGGCEDPRTTIIGNRLYMTYVAFDGFRPPRIALTSISTKELEKRDWRWRPPILISPPDVVDKSACLFPEMINDKYLIIHRIFPNILFDYLDDLEFKDKKYIRGQYQISPRRPIWWDSRKIGAGAPPLKTKEGWLLIYQAVDDKDSSRYLVGAMILDYGNPTKVLYRSCQPIIEPDQWYENKGFKAGVVYPCGAVIKDRNLFVYYGGADSYVNVAFADLDQFLIQLKEEQPLEIEPIKSKKIR